MTEENFGLSVGEPKATQRAFAHFEYESSGPLAIEIPRAIILRVNDKEISVLSVPQDLGVWSERIDFAFALIEGTNSVEVETWTYNFTSLLGDVSTLCSARIWVENKRILSESYSPRLGRRKSIESFLFNPAEL